jgi:hypothetical protein
MGQPCRGVLLTVLIGGRDRDCDGQAENYRLTWTPVVARRLPG